ncbi:MAG: RsiV family protein [Altibacter sp.]|uniref:RsiV family protein n=1 Tax=Altibacter sp. TaxID=2024823 RepID=UPI001D79DDBE|nr:RsiV family protein [Altibacter sp.]MBZ0327973.1 RsiV family protein [Altibacter sp.]
MKSMKYLSLLLVFGLLISCKNDSQKKETDAIEDVTDVVEDSLVVSDHDIDLRKQQTIQIKREELIKKEDERVQLEDLVLSKTFFKEEDLYVLDFKYPHLNEALKPSYRNFNEYVQKYYIDIKGVEAQILEDKELYCDTLRTNRYREKRLVDYKIYNINEKLISVLFYKENYYSGAMHPSYTFDCLNFDLNRAVFMNYEDFFNDGSEEELRVILNELLQEKIASGEFFYDCWQISEEDFFEYKNNFVVDETFVEFYFDDCVICPSYTGTYSIKIPLVRLLPVLRKYKFNPLIS